MAVAICWASYTMGKASVAFTIIAAFPRIVMKAFAPLMVLIVLITGCSSESETVAPATVAEQQPKPAVSNPTEPAKTEQESRQISSEQSHRLMLRVLEQLKAKVPDHKYLGDAMAQKLRRVTTVFPDGLDDIDRTALLIELGLAELRLGNELEAIESLDRAAEFLRGAEGEEELIQDANLQLSLEMGIAYMRLAETQNCCQRNTPESCILPIRGEGIHTRQEPARKAIEHFRNALRIIDSDSRLHLRARWLMNIAYMTIGEYPEQVPEEYLISVSSQQSDVTIPQFINISSELGINTFSLSGGAVGDDFDGDDLLDLMVSTWDWGGQLRFFHNNGDGTFEDRTAESGLEGIIGGLNLVQADYNNDGHVDVYLLRGAWQATKGLHPNSLLRNNGNGTFTDVTFSSGLGNVQYPTQTASWADYNNDGHIDLYVGNEHGSGQRGPCQLFENQGNGTFKDVARKAGVTNNRFTKAVIWGDYDNDRWPDLYVSNLYEANRMYRNLGDGTFKDVTDDVNCPGPQISFPSWFFDVDNDGALDLLVTAYLIRVEDLATAYLDPANIPDVTLPHLYKGDGKGGFKQVGSQWNLVTPSAPMGANFGDLNGDGFLDFYLGTGDPEYYSLMPNVMYLNRNGEAFDDVTMSGGFGHLQKGHAVVYADFDNDGDQDVFEQLGGAYPGDKFFDAFFENPGFDHHWITIHLVGKTSNRSAIGARIRVDITEDGKPRTVYKHVNSGGTFGANPLRQNIGLRNAEQIDRVEIFWPTTGETQVFEDVPLDKTIRIEEDGDSFAVIDLPIFDFSPEEEAAQ